MILGALKVASTETVKNAAGVSMSLATDEPRNFLKVSMLVLREVREVWAEIRGVAA